MLKDKRFVETVKMDYGTELEIWKRRLSGELIVKLHGEELPFLRVACPNFVNIIALAFGPHAEVLAIQKESDDMFAVVTNRGHYHIKREAGEEWAIKYVDQTAVKLYGGKRKQPA